MFKAIILSALLCGFACARSGKEYQTTEISQHPHHVSIQKQGKHACSGAIISETVIITTASCLHNAQPLDVNIRVGSDQFESAGEVKAAKSLILHKRYQTSRKDYDIALIVLEEALTFSDTVRSVGLPNTNSVNPPKQGTIGTLTGFGLNGEDYTDVLEAEQLEVSVPINCKNAYAGLFIYITERMFCAELKPKHACRGDSGSPLVIDDILVGVSAWEEKCGSSKYPGIYTNIANLRKWIRTEVDV